MATIKDVAALSGVSVTTVSRVLNKRGYISEDTYKKVYDAMAELNYQPNQLARSLSKQKTNFIGLLVHICLKFLFLTMDINSYSVIHKEMTCANKVIWICFDRTK